MAALGEQRPLGRMLGERGVISADQLRIALLEQNKNHLPRGKLMVNPKIPTGEVEVLVKKLEVLTPAEQPVPLQLDERADVSEEYRLRYRYLEDRKSTRL